MWEPSSFGMPHKDADTGGGIVHSLASELSPYRAPCGLVPNWELVPQLWSKSRNGYRVYCALMPAVALNCVTSSACASDARSIELDGGSVSLRELVPGPVHAGTYYHR